MINLSTNWVVVTVAAVASMVLGFLWYSNFLFGKEWSELMGFKAGEMKMSKKGMSLTYLFSTLATIVMSFILKQFVDLFYIVNPFDAIQLAFWLWLGFVATTMVTNVLYGKQSWKLFVINSGYQLASVIVMALIFSYWQ